MNSRITQREEKADSTWTGDDKRVVGGYKPKTKRSPIGIVLMIVGALLLLAAVGFGGYYYSINDEGALATAVSNTGNDIAAWFPSPTATATSTASPTATLAPDVTPSKTPSPTPTATYEIEYGGDEYKFRDLREVRSVKDSDDMESGKQSVCKFAEREYPCTVKITATVIIVDTGFEFPKFDALYITEDEGWKIIPVVGSDPSESLAEIQSWSYRLTNVSLDKELTDLIYDCWVFPGQGCDGLDVDHTGAVTLEDMNLMSRECSTAVGCYEASISHLRAFEVDPYICEDEDDCEVPFADFLEKYKYPALADWQWDTFKDCWMKLASGICETVDWNNDGEVNIADLMVQSREIRIWIDQNGGPAKLIFVHGLDGTEYIFVAETEGLHKVKAEEFPAGFDIATSKYDSFPDWRGVVGYQMECNPADGFYFAGNPHVMVFQPYNWGLMEEYYKVCDKGD